MVGARLVLGALIVATTAAVLSPTASADCHTSWTGCTPCPTDDCGDLIGTVAGILISGDAEEGEPEDDPQLAAAVAQAQGKDGRAGHILLRFEREDGNAAEPVPLRLMFSGNVQWPGPNQENFTAEFTFQGDLNLTFEYTIRGPGHRHIPFRIMAHPDTPQEEMLEGVFTISQPVRDSGASWPWAAGLVPLAAIAWLRRR